MSSNPEIQRRWNPLDLSAKKRSQGYHSSHRAVEKRRRDRINRYLDAIRALLPLYTPIPVHKRLDKADVLDKTVVYLKMVHTFLENLGVPDILSAVNQQIKLMSNLEKWIHSNKSRYDSVSSFVGGLSKYIECEQKASCKYVAEALMVAQEPPRNREDSFFGQKHLERSQASVGCSNVGEKMQSSTMLGLQQHHVDTVRGGRDQELSALDMQMECGYSKSVSSAGNVDLNVKHVDFGPNVSVAYDDHSSFVASKRISSFPTLHEDVGLVQLLQTKGHPVRPEQGGLYDGDGPSEQDQQTMGKARDGYTNNIPSMVPRVGRIIPAGKVYTQTDSVDVGLKMDVAQEQDRHREGENSHSLSLKRFKYSKSGINNIPHNTLNNLQTSPIVNNRSDIVQCLPRPISVGVDGRPSPYLEKPHSSAVQGQADSNLWRHRCHCEFKVLVRDQGVNTDKSSENALLEKELTLKVNAGPIELDLSSLLLRAQSKKGDCTIPVSFKGQVSLDVGNSRSNSASQVKLKASSNDVLL